MEEFDGSMQTWFFCSEESCCLVSSQVFQYMRLRGKSIRQALAWMLRDLASRRAGGSDCPPSPNMLSLRRPLQFVPTAVCYLLSVVAPTLSDVDPPLAAAAARGEQGRRLSAAALAERPVVSWWRAVSAQQGRSAEQVTQGCVRPFPDSRQVIS